LPSSSLRDKIPDIIKNNGSIPITRVLNNEEYLKCLNEKLQEEVDEYLRDPSVEEMTDVLEVLEAIASVMGFTKNEIERTKTIKASEKGTFKNRIFLEKVLIKNSIRKTE